MTDQDVNIIIKPISVIVTSIKKTDIVKMDIQEYE